LNTIPQNYNDWHIEEEDMTRNKRGILELSDEDMKKRLQNLLKKRVLKLLN
jgi:hypothetical protein